MIFVHCPVALPTHLLAEGPIRKGEFSQGSGETVTARQATIAALPAPANIIQQHLILQSNKEGNAVEQQENKGRRSGSVGTSKYSRGTDIVRESDLLMLAHTTQIGRVTSHSSTLAPH